jgi:hypothetical protein
MVVIGLVHSFERSHLFADLADFNEELHRRALTNPVDCLPAFEDAFEGVVRDQDEASKVNFRNCILLAGV